MAGLGGGEKQVWERMGPEPKCQMVGTKVLGMESYFCLREDEVDLCSMKVGDGLY